MENMIVKIRGGLLLRHNLESIHLPLADWIAQANGFMYVERMVGARAWLDKTVSINAETYEILSSLEDCSRCNKGQAHEGGPCANCGGSGHIPL